MKMALLLSAVSIVGSLSPTIMQANALGVQEEEVVTEKGGGGGPRSSIEVHQTGH